MAKDTVTFEYELGARARDKITGFQGKITGRADYLTGCRQYVLEGLAQGAPHSAWLDEDRVELVEPVESTHESRREAFDALKRRGGPMNSPTGKAPL